MADRPESKPQKSTPPPQSGAAKDGPAKPRWWHDRRKLAVAVAGALIVLGAGAAIAYSALKRAGDVVTRDVLLKPEEPHKPVVKTTNWPMYGYNRRHTR